MNLQNLVDYAQEMQLPDLFSGVRVPEEFDIELVKSYIMMRCGLLTPVYNDPNTFRLATTVWFNAHQWNFEHILKMVKATYSPIENVDRYDSTETNVNGETLTNLNSYTKNIDSGTDTFTNSGVDTITQSGQDVETMERTVSAYNTNDYSNDSKNVDTTDYGKIDTKNYGKIDTTNYGKISDGTRADTETGSNNSTTTYTQHLHGNVGVTSNQNLLTQEKLLLETFNAYEMIAEMFEADNMIMLY